MYRARCIAKLYNFDEHAESYKNLNKYIYYLIIYNPGIVVKIQLEIREIDSDPLVFKRIYIIFDAIKKRVLEDCRLLIDVDDCHLKGPYGVILLYAVVLDGNRGVLPLAFGIVELEYLNSRNFFMENLYDYIGGGTNNKPFIFMSD